MFINVHASLLPDGAELLPESIEMDKETGISIKKIVPKLDEIYLMQEKLIDKNDNYLSLSKIIKWDHS